MGNQSLLANRRQTHEISRQNSALLAILSLTETKSNSTLSSCVCVGGMQIDAQFNCFTTKYTVTVTPDFPSFTLSISTFAMCAR